MASKNIYVCEEYVNDKFFCEGAGNTYIVGGGTTSFIDEYVNTTGDTMTGNLLMNGDGDQNLILSNAAIGFANQNETYGHIVMGKWEDYFLDIANWGWGTAAEATVLRVSGHQTCGKEATLALVRGSYPDIEFLDLYNNGYNDSCNHGIRVQSRGNCLLRDFKFDSYNGTTYTDAINIKYTNLNTSTPLEIDFYADLNVTGDVDITNNLTATCLSGILNAGYISGTMGVANGGTGRSVFGTNRILTTNGTGALTDESGLTYDPVSGLVVEGLTTTDTLRVKTGAATGCVLTSDSIGYATWQTPPSAYDYWGLTDGSISTNISDGEVVTFRGYNTTNKLGITTALGVGNDFAIGLDIKNLTELGKEEWNDLIPIYDCSTDTNKHITVEALMSGSNSYVTGVTGNGNGTLTLSRNNALADLTTDLDHNHSAGDLPLTVMYEGDNITLLTNNAGYVTSNNYAVGVSGSGNGTLTICRSGLGNISTSLAHTHSDYVCKTTYGTNSFVSSYLIFNDGGTSNRDFLSYNDTTNAYYFNADTSLTTSSANAKVYAGTFYGSGAGLTGTATSLTAGNANCLYNLPYSSFLRSDAADQKTSGDLRFNDNICSTFGSSNDMRMYHDGSNSYIDNLTGNFYLRTYDDNLHIALKAIKNSYTQLFYSGQVRLETLNTGACISGCGFATDFISSSDCRLKDNIEPVVNALSKVDALCGVCYDFCNDGTPDMGLIAQDVEKVEPRLVTKDEDEIYGLKYDKFAGLFVEAIKELKEQNQCLQIQINELRKK